jgi:hypothetical protein
MSLDNVWLSYVDYRPDPARPEEERIVLGCILEAARPGGGRSFSVAGRLELTESELHVLDGIGREMLAHPSEFLRQELHRVIGQSGKNLPSFKEGGVLGALARVHRWSFHVSPPRLIRLQRALSQNNLQALDAANEQLLIAHLLGREVPLSRPLRANQIIPHDWRAQVPPAWQIEHSSLAAPARL